MSDELTEEQDSTPVEETQPTETVEPTETPAVDGELERKNKELYERTKKAEARAKELEAQLKSSEPITNISSDERFERLDLKTEGYNADEVAFLMRNGGRKALGDRIVMAGIEAIRQKAKSANATPSGTAKSPVYKKYTEDELKRMPAEELEKIL